MTSTLAPVMGLPEPGTNADPQRKGLDRMALRYTARRGFFWADRANGGYTRRIWDVTPFPLSIGG